MHSTTPITIGKALQLLHQHTPHQPARTAATVVCAWKAHMPPPVRQRTVRAFFKKNTLFVQLSSAPLRHTLQLQQQQILTLLQAATPARSLEKVIFL